jgi:tripartite-type tricarboxylate transporter receptor subunit TctC
MRMRMTIATALAAKAAPDGHTLLVTTIAFAINASLQKQPFDAVKDFAPITEIASIPLMLVVHNSLPVHNVKEFIEYSKAQPAGLDYATSGPGTSTHLAAEMFKTMTGANLVHVPFKGNAEVMNALLGGHVKVHFALTASTLQHVRSGALRVLAVTTEQRLPDLPDVPTIAELGYPGYEISSWQGVFAPAGTPKDIIGKLNSEIVAMLKTPAVQERIKREGAVPIGSSPEQWSTRFQSEVSKWAKVAKSAGLSPAH